jgi:hypothetical protein
MSIFKLDSKIYGAWSVEKENNVCLDYHWNDSHDSPCESNAQIALKYSEDSNKRKASRDLKAAVLNKADLPD